MKISDVIIVPNHTSISNALGKTLTTLGLHVDPVTPRWRPRNPYALVLVPGADQAGWIERCRLSGVGGICIVLGRATDPHYIGHLLFDDLVFAHSSVAISTSLKCFQSEVRSRNVLDIAVTLLSRIDWHGLASRFQDLYESLTREAPPRAHADWERLESLADLRDDLTLHMTSTGHRMHDALRLFLVSLARGDIGDAVSLLVGSRKELVTLQASFSAKEDVTKQMKSAFPLVKRLREQALSLRVTAAEHVLKSGGS